jgi:hypothetical protein
MDIPHTTCFSLFQLTSPNQVVPQALVPNLSSLTRVSPIYINLLVTVPPVKWSYLTILLLSVATTQMLGHHSCYHLTFTACFALVNS